jgi:glutathione-regulated potassium-efflux system protein KefB
LASSADRRRPQRTDRRRLELSAIVAYLFAGIIIGPYGLAAFGTPESIIPVSELGVVMLLFLIGLELELGRLLAMRRAIFSLGAAQLTLTALTIGALGYVTGLVDWQPEAEEIISHPPAAE